MTTSSLSQTATILHLLRAAPLMSTLHDGRDDPGSRNPPRGMYRSPTTGWRLRFDPARWRTEDETSDDETDTLVLTSRQEDTTSTRVSFHTSPRGPDTLRARLEAAAEGLTYGHPGATVDAALDAEGGSIFTRLGEYHWIGSYIISALPGNDLIVELDAIGTPDADAVIIVESTAPPSEYDAAFYPVEMLRAGMVYHDRELVDSSNAESGGSRPRVQY